jgi:hypothetical protein
MNAPSPVMVAGKDGPEFFHGTSFEVQAVMQAYQELAHKINDLSGAHSFGQAIPMKLAADDVAKLAGQINIMSAHLSKMATAHIDKGRKE